MKKKRTSAKPITILVPNKSTRVVAIKSIRDPKVIASGRSYASLFKKLDKLKGKEAIKPILCFVPRPGERHIY